MDDSQEQLGRFCPIHWHDAVSGTDVDDYNVQGTYVMSAVTAAVPDWRYRFATKLFDYLTVQSPASDYKPNIDPTVTTSVPVQNGINPAADPYRSPVVNPNGENDVGVNGLFNINTSPWWVLASLPLLPNDIAGNSSFVAAAPPLSQHNNDGIPQNIENLAKAIVLWRDGDGTAAHLPHGPFRTIFDLNDVQDVTSGNYVFRDAIALLKNPAAPPPTYDPGNSDGDLSPHTGIPDGVHDSSNGVVIANAPWDFEERYLMLDRISNLITTRSDSFTVYIVVQGWRNVGGTTPQLVAQRRAAFIIDRSNVTGVSGAAGSEEDHRFNGLRND